MLEVDDSGRRITLEYEWDLKVVAPQEFKLLVKMNGEFDFLGWWKSHVDSWDLSISLENATEDLNYNMILLRRC